MTWEDVLFSKELNNKIPGSTKNNYNLAEILDKKEFTLLSKIKLEYVEPNI